MLSDPKPLAQVDSLKDELWSTDLTNSLLFHLAEGFYHLVGAFCVPAGGRLIRQHQAGVVDQRPGDGHALLLCVCGLFSLRFITDLPEDQ